MKKSVIGAVGAVCAVGAVIVVTATASGDKTDVSLEPPAGAPTIVDRAEIDGHRFSVEEYADGQMCLVVQPPGPAKSTPRGSVCGTRSEVLEAGPIVLGRGDSESATVTRFGLAPIGTTAITLKGAAVMQNKRFFLTRYDGTKRATDLVFAGTDGRRVASVALPKVGG